MLGKYTYKIDHDLSVITTSPLPPHRLVQVRLEIFSPNSFLSLQAQLQSAPAWLHLLSMHTRTRIDEMAGMHHNFMSTDVWKAGEVPVYPPIVGVNLATRQKTLLYYGAKSRCVSPVHYGKITPRWTVFGRDNAKYPHLTMRSPSPVILQMNGNEMVVRVFCQLQCPLGATWKINRLP